MVEKTWLPPIYWPLPVYFSVHGFMWECAHTYTHTPGCEPPDEGARNPTTATARTMSTPFAESSLQPHYKLLLNHHRNTSDLSYHQTMEGDTILPQMRSLKQAEPSPHWGMNTLAFPRKHLSVCLSQVLMEPWMAWNYITKEDRQLLISPASTSQSAPAWSVPVAWSWRSPVL